MPEVLSNKVERRACKCGCRKKFVVSKLSPRMFFSRACAAQHNAGSFKRPRQYRRQTVGVKERGVSGLGSMAESLRKYEDKKIAEGTMPPRKNFRDMQTREVNAAKHRRATAAKKQK